MRRCFFLAVLLLPAVASAEVLDKEFTGPMLVGASLVLGLVGFWSTYRSRLLIAILVAGIASAIYGSHLSEFLDPHVGPAMAREGGRLYLAISWATPLMVLAGLLSGWFMKAHRAKTAVRGRDNAV